MAFQMNESPFYKASKRLSRAFFYDASSLLWDSCRLLASNEHLHRAWNCTILCFLMPHQVGAQCMRSLANALWWFLTSDGNHREGLLTSVSVVGNLAFRLLGREKDEMLMTRRVWFGSWLSHYSHLDTSRSDFPYHTQSRRRHASCLNIINQHNKIHDKSLRMVETNASPKNACSRVRAVGTKKFIEEEDALSMRT